MPKPKRFSVYILDRKANRTIVFDADSVKVEVQSHFMEVFDVDTKSPVERPSGDQTLTVKAFAENLPAHMTMYKDKAGNCIPTDCLIKES